MTRLSKVLARVLLGIAGGMLIVSALLMTAEVTQRYVIGRSIMWAEETIAMLMLYITFLASGPVLMRGAHVKMSIVYERFPKRLRKWVDASISMLGIIFSSFLCWSGILLVKFLIQSGITPYTATRLGPWVLALGLPLGMAFLTLYFIHQLFTILTKGETETEV